MRAFHLRHLLFFFLAFIPAIGSSQIIPDYDFEKWNNVPFFFPTGMSTSGSVTRISPGYEGNYAIKIQASSGGVLPGEFGYGNLNGTGFSGGIPFTSRPDSVSGYFADYVAVNDTAWVFLILKSGGHIVASDSISFTTSNTVVYTHYKSAIKYRSLSAPDSLIFLVCSSRPSQIKDSSYVYADEISFTHSATPFPNGNLETWYSRSYREPLGWTTGNHLGLTSGSYPVKDTGDAFSGHAACRMMSLNEGSYFLNGYSLLGTIKGGVVRPGMKVYQVDSLLSGYYKFIPRNGDTASFSTYLYRNDSLVGSGIFISRDSAVEWTPFVVRVTYIPGFKGAPDSAAILFAAYHWNSPTSLPLGNSILEVDEISFNSFATGIEDLMTPESSGLIIAPNPFNDYTMISFHTVSGEPTKLELFNTEGKLVQVLADREFTTGAQTLSLNRAGLPPGVYLLTLRSGNNLLNRRVVVLR